jgi:hypothetical protein
MRIAVASAGLAGLLILGGCTDTQTSSDQVSPGASQSTMRESHPTATASTRGDAHPHRLRGDWEKLGPNGFLELRLGMSRAEAVGTGRISIGKTVGRCTGFYLAMYGDGSGLGAHGYFSKGRGLSVIHGQDEMHTPQGIRLGSHAWTLQDTYAHLVGSESFMTAPASDRGSYFFIIENDTVSYFGLALPGDPCLTAWIRRNQNRQAPGLPPLESTCAS